MSLDDENTLKPEQHSVLRVYGWSGKLTKLVHSTYTNITKYSYAKILGAHSGVYRDFSLLWFCKVSTGKLLPKGKVQSIHLQWHFPAGEGDISDCLSLQMDALRPVYESVSV
jgi:hypothetical protein